MSTFNIKLIASVCTANLLSFAVGNSCAWSSTALVMLKKKDISRNPLGRPITTLEESWIASLVSLGATFGPVFAGYCSAKFGRKRTLLMFSVPMLIAYLILVYASTPTEIYLARFMIGLGVGCVLTVMPIYVGEVAETPMRGFLGSLMTVLLSIGLLFVYAIGPMVNFATLNIIMIMPLILFQFFFGLFVPESPYFYVTKRNEISAQKSLHKLRTKHHCSLLEELEEIRKTVNESEDSEEYPRQFMKAKSFRKSITITATLMVLQQFIGITTILSYLEDIFIASESPMSSSTSTIIVSSIQIVVVILSSYLSDRWGRRILLLLATGGSSLPLMTIGLYFYMKNTGTDISSLWWLPIASLITFIIIFNFGMGSLPWVLVGELFSSKTKSLASTISATVNLSLAFLITLICPMLKDMIGFQGVFWFFGVNAFLGMLFIFEYVPETKEKSFQEILRILEE